MKSRQRTPQSCAKSGHQPWSENVKTAGRGQEGQRGGEIAAHRDPALLAGLPEPTRGRGFRPVLDFGVRHHFVTTSTIANDSNHERTADRSASRLSEGTAEFHAMEASTRSGEWSSIERTPTSAQATSGASRNSAPARSAAAWSWSANPRDVHAGSTAPGARGSPAFGAAAIHAPRSAANGI